MKTQARRQLPLPRRLASICLALAMFAGVTAAVTVGPDIVNEPAPAAAEVGSNYWWGHATWYSINDVRWQADYWKVLTVAKKACDRMPWWVGKQACKRAVGLYVDWIYNGWQTAKNNGWCLQINMLWTGQVTKVRPYACGWY